MEPKTVFASTHVSTPVTLNFRRNRHFIILSDWCLKIPIIQQKCYELYQIWLKTQYTKELYLHTNDCMKLKLREGTAPTWIILGLICCELNFKCRYGKFVDLGHVSGCHKFRTALRWSWQFCETAIKKYNYDVIYVWHLNMNKDIWSRFIIINVTIHLHTF